jgi:hypothetical protein
MFSPGGQRLNIRTPLGSQRQSQKPQVISQAVNVCQRLCKWQEPRVFQLVENLRVVVSQPNLRRFEFLSENP